MLTKQQVLDAIAVEKKKVLALMISARQAIADLAGRIEHTAVPEGGDPGSHTIVHSAAELDQACGHMDAAALMLGEPVEAKPKGKAKADA